MMDYTHEILTAMVDRYERRNGTSAQNGKIGRASCRERVYVLV